MPEDSLAVQWLNLGTPIAGGRDLISGWRTKVLHRTLWCSQKQKYEDMPLYQSISPCTWIGKAFQICHHNHKWQKTKYIELHQEKKKTKKIYSINTFIQMFIQKKLKSNSENGWNTLQILYLRRNLSPDYIRILTTQ